MKNKVFQPKRPWVVFIGQLLERLSTINPQIKFILKKPLRTWNIKVWKHWNDEQTTVLNFNGIS
jgi:hypothetical protein